MGTLNVGWEFPMTLRPLRPDGSYRAEISWWRCSGRLEMLARLGFSTSATRKSANLARLQVEQGCVLPVTTEPDDLTVCR
jgi:hypothetical protein